MRHDWIEWIEAEGSIETLPYTVHYRGSRMGAIGYLGIAAVSAVIIVAPIIIAFSTSVMAASPATAAGLGAAMAKLVVAGMMGAAATLFCLRRAVRAGRRAITVQVRKTGVTVTERRLFSHITRHHELNEFLSLSVRPVTTVDGRWDLLELTHRRPSQSLVLKKARAIPEREVMALSRSTGLALRLAQSTDALTGREPAKTQALSPAVA